MAAKVDLSNWEEVHELREWLQDVKPKTRANYLTDFRKYMQFTGLTPKQMIDEAEAELKLPRRQRGKVKQRILEFYEWLLNEYTTKKKVRGKRKKGLTNYRARIAVRGILSFYRKNGITINVKLPKAVPKKENFRIELSPGDVKRMVAKAGSLRNKAIILLGFQSGLDAKTVTMLDIADLPRGVLDAIKRHRGNPEKVLEEVPTPWLLHIVREKAAVNFHTCLGRDGAEALILHLWERIQKGEELTLRSPLFVREEKGYHKLRGTEERRIEERHIHEFMRTLPVEAGIIEPERVARSDINPCGFHSLRASFSRILKANGMPESFVEYMMGHSLPYNAAYSKPLPEKLVEAYREHEHALSISATSTLGDVEAKIEEMRKHYSAVIQDLTVKNRALEEDIKRLKETIEKTQNELNNYKEHFGDAMELLMDIMILHVKPAKKQDVERAKRRLMKLTRGNY